MKANILPLGGRWLTHSVCHPCWPSSFSKGVLCIRGGLTSPCLHRTVSQSPFLNVCGPTFPSGPQQAAVNWSPLMRSQQIQGSSLICLRLCLSLPQSVSWKPVTPDSLPSVLWSDYRQSVYSSHSHAQAAYGHNGVCWLHSRNPVAKQNSKTSSFRDLQVFRQFS